MTTYQEPPLQSRRAARAGEQADAPPGATSDPNTEAVTPPPASSSAEPLNYATTSRPPLPQYDGQSLRPRRSAETTGHADLPPTQALPEQDAPSYRSKDFSPEGRRAAAPAWAAPSDGTVDFQTQNRDQAMAAAVPSAPSGVSAAVPEGTMTRRELRALREATGITEVPTDQTAVVSAPIIAPGEAAPRDASTVPPAPAAEQPVAEEPVAEEPVAEEPVAEEPVVPSADARADSDPIAASPAPIALVMPPPLIAPAPQPSSRLDSALAEFDALAAGREPVAPAPDAPAPLPGRRAAQQVAPVTQQPVTQQPITSQPVAPQPDDQAPIAEMPVVPAPAESVAESVDGLSTFDVLFAAPSPQESAPVVDVAPAPPQAAPAPAPMDPLLSAPAPQGAPASVPPPASAYPMPVDLPAPSAVVQPGPVPPASGPSSVGHWSTQSDIDDAEQVNETTISRSVGSGNGAITTSALVLPSIPEQTIGGAVGAGGEILLTGSISLPQSLSATGAHPSQLDESDLDHLLDPGDHQVANTDSTPVRAIRAVSTHTATGGIIAPHKPSGTRGFTILIIAAAAMAAVVVGLLVVGFVSGTI